MRGAPKLKQSVVLLRAGLLATLSGCAVGPDYQPPGVFAPSSFSAAPGALKRASAASITPSSAQLVRWWHILNDRQLNALVECAVASNLDIKAALTRVQRARMEEIVVLGAALPQVGVSATQAAGTGTDLTKGSAGNALRAGSNTTGLDQLSRLAGFEGGWQLDIFGKYMRLLEAAQGDTEALAEMRHAVLITTIADVVRNYIEIRGLQSRLEAARTDVTTGEKTVDLVQSRYDRGLTSEVDVTLAKTELARLRARVPQLTAAIEAAQHRIGVLLDTYEVIPSLQRPGRLPRLPDSLQPGLPIALLQRRPDIRQAERELAAATARIGAATADLLPAVAVTTGLGVQGGPRSPGGPAPINGPIWSIGPAGTWPFLDLGRMDALVYVQEFQAHELLLKYKQTILTAVAEVDIAIKGYRAARQRSKDLETALAESRRSVELATERYDRGLTDFLNVLEAQRAQYELDEESIVAQQAAAIEFVIFYKALGGGWERYDGLPPIPQPEPAVAAMFRRLFYQER
jgi:NodT family efflux transporter outer membrane factor (OMF) lipoprotein